MMNLRNDDEGGGGMGAAAAATAPDDAGTTARADPLVLCVAADDASAGVAVSTYAASDDELTAELRPDSKSRSDAATPT